MGLLLTIAGGIVLGFLILRYLDVVVAGVVFLLGAALALLLIVVACVAMFWAIRNVPEPVVAGVMGVVALVLFGIWLSDVIWNCYLKYFSEDVRVRRARRRVYLESQGRGD